MIRFERHVPLVAATMALAAVAAHARPEGAASRPAWVAKSDANSRVLLDVLARFSPESAGEYGLEAYDEQVLDMKPGVVARSLDARRNARAELQTRLDAETDPHVRQDLQILVGSVEEDIEGLELSRKTEVFYLDLPRAVFEGLRGLLDEQVAPARRRKAVLRLQRYAGMKGDPPIAMLVRERIRESLADASLIGPYKGEVEKALANGPRYVDGIRELFRQFQVKGYEKGLRLLEEQLADYEGFVRKEVLPRARADFRLPPPVYAQALRRFGVTTPPEELAQTARIAFLEIQNEMRAIAPLVAREKGLSSSDYRDVIRELKKDQLQGEAILPHYEARMRALEEIIRRERIVTLPERPARIRLASEAESAAIPAPHMRSPRLIENTGERGEFVLPLSVPTAGSAGQAMTRFDDFTFEAASWTLTVHEGRPGHELQWASLVENGVSLARALFAFKSVNVEGWALYMEAEMKPYLPLDGQLVSLQHRLLRAARAFVDPELQLGQIEPEEAVKLLMGEVVVSEPMARQEVERYMFRAPGQATSYFYGYRRWLQLRSEAALALGTRFDRQRYHDFLLAQGLLPPDLLADAVMKEFVPAEEARVH